MLKRVTPLALSTAALAIAPATALAVTQPANGGATNLTTTSATLNGTIYVASADSAWQFDYGTSTAYGSHTQARAVDAKGFYAVAATIQNLKPGKTYHFRLTVYDGYSGGGVAYSDDKSFTTPADSGNPGGKQPGGGNGQTTSYGVLSLRGNRFKLQNNAIPLSVHCSGTAGAICRGRLSLRAGGKQNNAIRCGGARFSATAKRSMIVQPHLSKGCQLLVHLARKHKLRATLQASFSTRQTAFSRRVTLVG